MATVVTFSHALWVARYPEFAAVSSDLGQLYFDEAGLYCANDPCNPVGASLSALLYMMTSHIAWLNAPRDARGMPSTTGKPASPIVGRISTASEGSVSVSTENSYEPGTPQWYQQTTYGAAYWAATAGFRTMRYMAQPTVIGQPLFPYRFGTRRFF